MQIQLGALYIVEDAPPSWAETLTRVNHAAAARDKRDAVKTDLAGNTYVAGRGARPSRAITKHKHLRTNNATQS